MNSILGTAIQDQQLAVSDLLPQAQRIGGGSLLGACPQPTFEHQHQQQYQQQYHQQFHSGFPALPNGDNRSSFGNRGTAYGNSLLGSLHAEGQSALQFNHNSSEAASAAHHSPHIRNSTSILGSVGASESVEHVTSSLALLQQCHGRNSLLGSICPATSAQSPASIGVSDSRPLMLPYSGNPPLTQGMVNQQANPLSAVSAGATHASLLGSVGGSSDEFLVDQCQYFRTPAATQVATPISSRPATVGFRSSGGGNSSILGSAAPDTEGPEIQYRQHSVPVFSSPLVPAMAIPARGNTSSVPSSIHSLLGSVSGEVPGLHPQNNSANAFLNPRRGHAFAVPLSGEVSETVSLDPLIMNGHVGGNTARSVVVENLPAVIAGEELKATLHAWCSFGRPLEISVPWPGTARLVFADASLAVTAIQLLNGQQFHGHILRVFMENLPPEIFQDGLRMTNRTNLPS